MLSTELYCDAANMQIIPVNFYSTRNTETLEFLRKIPILLGSDTLMDLFMNEQWPTQHRDLQIAAHIIQRHIHMNRGEPLGLFEVKTGEQEDFDFTLSDWVVELIDCFSELYGDEQGDFVTKMIVSQCLSQYHTLH